MLTHTRSTETSTTLRLSKKIRVFGQYSSIVALSCAYDVGESDLLAGDDEGGPTRRVLEVNTVYLKIRRIFGVEKDGTKIVVIGI